MTHDLTKGAIAPQLIKFTVPLILGNLFQLTYNAVDAAIVGRFVSKEALAGVGTVNPVMSLLILLFNGLCLGAGVLMGNAFGAHDEPLLRRQISTTMLAGSGFALLVSAICLVLSGSILTVMQVKPAVLPTALPYMRIIFLGLIFSFFYNFLSSTLRSLGDTLTPLLFLAVSAVLNVAGDLFFVIVLHMGANGCAVATVLSQALSCLFCLFYIQKRVPVLQLGKDWFVFDRRLLKKTVAFSWAGAAQQAGVQFGKVLIQSMVNTLSVAAAAAFSAVNRVEDFALTPEQNIAHAMTAFMAQNRGAGKADRVRQGFRDGVRICLIYGAAIGLVIFLFTGQIMSLFTEDAEVAAEGYSFLKLIAFIYILPALTNSVQGYFRGIGELGVTLLASTVNFTTRVIAVAVLFFVFHRGLESLPIAYLIGWICMLAAELPMLARKLREGREPIARG